MLLFIFLKFINNFQIEKNNQNQAFSPQISFLKFLITDLKR